MGAHEALYQPAAQLPQRGFTATVNFAILSDMRKILLFTLALLSLPLMALTDATRERVEEAMGRGFAYLRAKQSPDGSWSDRRFPGLSALILWAMARSGDGANAEASAKTEAYILSCAQPDGGLYVPIPGRRGGGLGNYNTCLCMTALHAAGGAARHTEVLLAARAYVASTQIETEGLHEGGFGYDKSSPRAYTDLNNTFYAIDAMRLTQDVEESRPTGQKHVDINWEAAKRYVLSMQEHEGEAAGSFVYNRELLRQTAAGVSTLRTHGSMTYAGLLAMLHCKLTRDDPRVRSTYQWLGKNWTLAENPGQGNQGLYFYYEILARALDAAGVEVLTLENGQAVDWREELALELLKRQQPDGSWVNESNRFWEGDPALSTGYALLTLSFTLPQN